RGHHYRAFRNAFVGREHGLQRIRIGLRSGVAIVVQIEDEPHDELVTRRLVEHVSCAARQPARLAAQLGLTKAAEIWHRYRQHQAHDEDYDREFEEREARRYGRQRNADARERDRSGAAGNWTGPRFHGAITAPG